MTVHVSETTNDEELVVAPGKALRLADMIEALVEEVHAAPLDDEARARFLHLYHCTLIEVGSTLSDALLEELARVQTRVVGDQCTFDELRVAMTQLEGWLQGVLIGVLTGSTSFALQVAGPDGEETAEARDRT